MGHRTKDDTPLKTSVFWTDGIADIVKARSAEMNRMKTVVTRTLEKAEATLERAERTFTAVKVKFGKGSGHKDYQRAESAVETARRHCRHSRHALEEVNKLPITINSEQVILYNAVEAFLDGKGPHPRCGSMRLSVHQDGNLHIFFNTDCEEIRGKRSDGHFVIKPDGYMHAMTVR